MKIQFRIDKKRYKIAQMIAIQKNDLEVILEVMAQNMICPGGEYMEKFEALAILKELNGEEFDELIVKLYEAVDEVNQNAVPLATNDKSSRRLRIEGNFPSGPGS